MPVLRWFCAKGLSRGFQEYSVRVFLFPARQMNPGPVSPGPGETGIALAGDKPKCGSPLSDPRIRPEAVFYPTARTTRDDAKLNSDNRNTTQQHQPQRQCSPATRQGASGVLFRLFITSSEGSMAPAIRQRDAGIAQRHPRSPRG